MWLSPFGKVLPDGFLFVSKKEHILKFLIVNNDKYCYGDCSLQGFKHEVICVSIRNTCISERDVDIRYTCALHAATEQC